MTARYRLTPRARDGFLRLVLIAEKHFGAIVANRVIDELVDAFQRLADHPGIGHRRERLTREPDIRFWSVGPTLIAYRSRGEFVEILFIERGELDWERLLGEKHS